MQEICRDLKEENHFLIRDYPIIVKGRQPRSVLYTHMMILHKQFAAVIYAGLACREQVAFLRIDLLNAPLSEGNHHYRDLKLQIRCTQAILCKYYPLQNSFCVRWKPRIAELVFAFTNWFKDHSNLFLLLSLLSFFLHKRKEIPKHILKWYLIRFTCQLSSLGHIVLEAEEAAPLWTVWQSFL